MSKVKTLLKLKEVASQDPVFFIDTFIKSFNPKVSPSEVKMVLFPFQRRLVKDLVKSITNGEDIFIDKCREMGVSYTILSTLIWFWLFVPGSNFLIGSRKEDYVDNRRGGVTGNKEESLFGKIDYMLSRIGRDAAFMLPNGFSQKNFTFMSLINPENGNVISGESANENFSRGSRYKAVFLDEFAFWDFGHAVWGATADTSNCRIVATTPGNKPSKAKRLRFGKDGEKIKIVTLTYDLDPRKSRKWLNEERGRRSTEDFNREIMVNWETSITGRVYPEIDNAAVGDFPFLVNQPLYCSWDFGLDETHIIFWQQNPANGKSRMVDSYHNSDQIVQFYFPFFGRPLDSKFVYTDDDLKAVREISQYPRSIHFGDNDVKKRSYVKHSSAIEELQKMGIFIQTISKNDFLYRRDITKLYLAKGIEINFNPRTEYTYEALKSYRFPAREENSQSTTPIIKPVHDWCLDGDTKIRTLNGWRTIRDLAGSSFYVWSYSHQFKRLIPMKSEKCWLVGKKKTLKVIIDNGDFIRCTSNHRFMLRDGSYVEASNLKYGDSLMPFYENESHREYVSIYLNDGSKGSEHRVVYNWFNGFLKQDFHIHHVDGNKTNNNPENLEQISKEDHCKLTKPQSGEKMSQSLKLYYEKNRSVKECPECGESSLMSYKQKFCSKKCSGKYWTRVRKSDNSFQKVEKVCVCCGNKYFGFSREKTCSKECAAERKNRYNNMYSSNYRSGNKISILDTDNFKENHKVLGIVDDGLEVDVYDIDVPETHNFVANGVVVHNSSHGSTSAEYFFINFNFYKSKSKEVPSWAEKIRKWTTSRSSLRR